MNKIVAVVGMCGAGKSRITDFFADKGWSRIYFGGVTIEEVKKRNLEINEQNERLVREDLRAKYGLAAIAVLLRERILTEAQTHNTILDGLYSWHEYTYLRELLGDELIVLAVVTNRKIRHDRLTSREIRPLDAASARRRDVAEIENLAKGGPIAIADHYVINNGDEAELFRQLEEFMHEIGE